MSLELAVRIAFIIGIALVVISPMIVIALGASGWRRRQITREEWDDTGCQRCGRWSSHLLRGRNFYCPHCGQDYKLVKEED